MIIFQDYYVWHADITRIQLQKNSDSSTANQVYANSCVESKFVMIYLRAHFALKLSRILNGIITKSFYGSITNAKT